MYILIHLFFAIVAVVFAIIPHAKVRRRIGAALIAMGWVGGIAFSFWNNHTLATSGVRTTGVVISKRCNARDDVSVAYTVGDSRFLISDVPYKGACTKHPIGDRLPVTYIKENPANGVLGVPARITIGPLAVLFVFFYFLVSFMSKIETDQKLKRNKNKLQTGQS